MCPRGRTPLAAIRFLDFCGFATQSVLPSVMMCPAGHRGASLPHGEATSYGGETAIHHFAQAKHHIAVGDTLSQTEDEPCACAQSLSSVCFNQGAVEIWL